MDVIFRISYAAIARALFLWAAAAVSMTSVAAQSGHTARGVVPDPSGAAAAGAEVQVLGASQTLAGAARTDEQGRFVVTVPRPGTYMLVIRSAGFADTRTSITVPLAGDQVLELTTRF